MKIVQIQELESILNEDPSIAKRRKETYNILKILEKSEKLMLADEE